MKNVLLITVDSLRPDYVFGSNAPDSVETLSRLASDGIRYTNAFSNAAYTRASFLSILSGTYPWMFDSVHGGYSPDRPHIAALLSDAGYATAGFNTNTYLSPTYNYDRGFDYYLGRDTDDRDEGLNSIETAYNNLVERALKIRGLSDIIHWTYSSVGKQLGIQLGSRLYKPAEELNNLVVEWTRRISQPAFVWVHYMDVHNPYYPHEGTVSEDVSRRKAVKLFHKVNELRGDAPQRDIDMLERLYRGEIEYLDRALGNLFERLDEILDLDNTLVVFTSDHGEAFNEHGHVFHPGYALHDENVHIPMILLGPEIGCGEVDVPVSNADIVPTVLSNVGINPPQSIVGDDVAAFLSQAPKNRQVFTEAFRREDGHVMVTNGRYKLIRNMKTGDETLYKRDGTTEETLEETGMGADIRGELSVTLDEHIQSVEQSRGRSGDIEVSEDVRLQLRKLGYDE